MVEEAYEDLQTHALLVPGLDKPPSTDIATNSKVSGEPVEARPQTSPVTDSHQQNLVPRVRVYPVQSHNTK